MGLSCQMHRQLFRPVACEIISFLVIYVRHQNWFRWRPSGRRSTLYLDFEKLRQVLQAAEPRQLPNGPADRRAAVFAIFVDRAETHLLLIRRAEQPNDPWSGQIAMPGGHLEDADANSTAAAYRETAEEVGIGKESIRMLGDLGLFATQIREVSVRAFVGLWDGAAKPRSNPAEVASIFEVPVGELLERHDGMGFHDRSPGELGEALTYPSDNGTIWGVTARILHRLLCLIGPPQQRDSQ